MLTLKDQLLLNIIHDYIPNSILVLILDSGATYTHEYQLLDYDEHDTQIFISSNFDSELNHKDKGTKIVGWYLLDYLTGEQQ